MGDLHSDEPISSELSCFKILCDTVATDKQAAYNQVQRQVCKK